MDCAVLPPGVLAAVAAPPLLVLLAAGAPLPLRPEVAVAAVAACCDWIRLCLLAASAASASFAASSSLPVHHMPLSVGCVAAWLYKPHTYTIYIHIIYTIHHTYTPCTPQNTYIVVQNYNQSKDIQPI